MGRLIRVGFILLTSLMVACGEFIVDDKDFSDNRRTLDITNDNAEELLWSAYQGFYSPFYYARLDRYLDASLLSATSSPVNCSTSGTYTANYPQLSGEDYQKGDLFSIEFSDCIEASGVRYNGLLSGRYLEIEGYNKAFQNVVSIDECAADVNEEEFDGLGDLIADEAEMILFDKQGARLFVRYLNPDPDNVAEVLEHKAYELDLNDRAVVLNRSATVTDSSLEDDGASVFIVEDGIQEKVDCAYYRRKIELSFQSFSVAVSDVTRFIEGSAELTHTLNSADNKVLRITSDSIKTSLELGNLKELYTLNDFDWRMEYDELVQGTYGAYFTAEFVNDLDGSIGEVRSFNSSALRGLLSELHPSSGIVTVNGFSGENTAMNVNNQTSLTVAIEAEGDQTGDGRGDKTADNFDLAWTEFLARDFVRPPVLPIEQPDEGSNPDFGNLLP